MKRIIIILCVLMTILPSCMRSKDTIDIQKLSDQKIEGTYVGNFTGNYHMLMRNPVFIFENKLRILNDTNPGVTEKEIEFDGNILCYFDYYFLKYFDEKSKDVFCVVIEHEDGNEIIGYKLSNEYANLDNSEMSYDSQKKYVRNLREYDNIEVSFRLKNSEIANIIYIDIVQREIIGSNENNKKLIIRRIDFPEQKEKASFDGTTFDPLGVTQDFIIGLETNSFYIIDKTKKIIIDTIEASSSDYENSTIIFHGKPYLPYRKQRERIQFNVGNTMFSFSEKKNQYGRYKLSEKTFKDDFNNSSHSQIISNSNGVFISSTDFKKV